MRYEATRCGGKQPSSERTPAILCGGTMVRLDLSYFYRLGVEFAAIRNLKPPRKMWDVYSALHDLQQSIIAILTDTNFGPALRGCGKAGREIVELLGPILARELDHDFMPWDAAQLNSKLNNLEAVLAGELAVADAYFVVEKKPYSTLSLVAEGETLFSFDLPRKVPEAVTDLREAGKCVAFELFTASAFHIHRAVESILRRYWEQVTGNQPKPKQRNIGIYLNGLIKLKCGDAKVIAALQQLKDLHRNVVIHPETSLNASEAQGLIGIANSVSAAMLKELPFVDVELQAPESDSFPARLDRSEEEAVSGAN